MAVRDYEQVALRSIEGTSPSIARAVKVPRPSKISQSTTLTAESAKTMRKDLFASAKARLGFSFGAQKENNPLNSAMAYKDISPASAHPRAPQTGGFIANQILDVVTDCQQTSTPASRIPSRIPTPTMTRTVSSSPVPAMSSPLAGKPLPSLPVARLRSDSPKHRRSLIDAEEKPLSRVISPSPGVLKEVNWPVLSPAKPTGMGEMSEIVKGEQKSVEKPDMDEAVLQPQFSIDQTVLHNIKKDKVRSSTRIPSLIASMNDLHLSPSVTVRETKTSLARAAVAKGRRASEMDLSPAEKIDRDSTIALPDPFRQKSPARSSGVFSSSIPTLLGAPGPFSIPPRIGQYDTNRSSPYSQAAKNSPDPKINPFKDNSKTGAKSPYERPQSANSTMSFIPASELGPKGEQTPTTETPRHVSALPVPKTRMSKAVGAVIVPTEKKVKAEVKAADIKGAHSTAVRRESASTTEQAVVSEQKTAEEVTSKAADQDVEEFGEPLRVLDLSNSTNEQPLPMITEGGLSPDPLLEQVPQELSAGEDRFCADDDEESDLASLRQFEESKQASRSKRLSKKYGPTLTISAAAERVILGSGNDIDSDEEDRKEVKRRTNVSGNLVRRGVEIKDSLRNSIHGLPRSLTGSTFASVLAEDDLLATEKGKGKAVAEQVRPNSDSLPKMTEALQMNCRISNVNDLNSFADETSPGQDGLDSWPLRNDSLASEQANTGSDDEPWIAPLDSSAKAKATSDSTYKLSSSPPPFPVPNNTPEDAVRRYCIEPSALGNLNADLEATKAAKASQSATKRFVNKLLHKKSTEIKFPTTPTVTNANMPSLSRRNRATITQIATAAPASGSRNPTGAAHEIIDMARHETNARRQGLILRIADRLVAVITQANNAEIARQQAEQAAIRAERAAAVAAQRAQEAEELMEDLLNNND